MKEKFRPYEPEQAYLFPPSPKDWLPEGHLAYFISETVGELDLRDLSEAYASDERGEKAYHPEMMLKVLLYGYATGVFSSRKLAKKVEEDIAFRYLAAGHFPSHRTIRRFRGKHLSVFEQIFVQVVQIAKEAELVKLGVLAIDGTKVKANANKHKAMSYGRMLEEEKKIRAEVKELLRRAEAVDEEEDQKFGEDSRGDEIPSELKRRDKRLEVIRAAKARIEQRQREKDSAKEREAEDEKKSSGKGSPGVVSKSKRKFGEPEPKAQDNITDPESRIMKTSSGGFEQCYNAQAAVDGQEQIIVAVGMTQSASDAKELIPMVEAVCANTGARPKVVLGDAGYRSEENLQRMEKLEVQALIALGREGREQAVNKDLKATIRCQRRLKTKRGDKLYRRRKTIVEPVLGMIKHALGFRMFLLRGYKKVLGEWNLVCCALNLKRMNGLMAWQ